MSKEDRQTPHIVDIDLNLPTAQEQDFRGLKIVQKQSLALMIELVAQDRLSPLVYNYIGEECCSRNADLINAHLNSLQEIISSFNSDNREELFETIFSQDRLYLEAGPEDTFATPAQISQELFDETELDDVLGFVTNDYPEFQMNVTTYLLQQLCRVKFSNPTLRISIEAKRRYKENPDLYEAAVRNLDTGRESRGLYPYSDEDIDTLVGLWMDGVSIKEVAHKLIRTPRSVQYHAAKFDLPLRKENRPWTTEEVQEVIRLSSEGRFGRDQIADMLDRSERAVHHKLVELGVVSFTRKPWSGEEHQLFLQLLGTETSYSDVLEKLSSKFPNGRNTNDLASRAKWLGFKLQTEFGLKSGELIRLTNEGYSDQEIAEMLGIARSTVGKWRRKLAKKTSS